LPQDETPRLEVRSLTKAYPALIANDRVNLVVQPGEIHAVLGENGAGKSTLMKSIYGVIKPDAGKIFWNGAEVSIGSPAQARSLGIGMVFQHFSLFETLTVTQNAALGLPGTPDLKDLARRIDAVSKQYGLAIDPQRFVYSLSVGERQRVEIIRCLLQNPQLLIMDEPTSVLTPQAVEKLFDTLRQLAANGCSILYISHKLHEIKALCQRATILRAGRVTGTCNPQEETETTMARLMVGQELVQARPGAHRPATGDAVLAIDHLDHPTADPFGTDLKDISLALCPGEIVGIAGVSGNGQQELLRVLSGESRCQRNEAIRLVGKAVGHQPPNARRQLGLCFVPEERLGRGAVPDLSLVENALMTAHCAGLAKNGLVDGVAVLSFAKRVIADFRVKCDGPKSAASSLSGGNLQKFIVGREILQKPRVFIVAQPTWGVDVHSSAFIRNTLVELRDAGVSILVVSDDLDELFEICDRMAVIASGRLSPAVRREETNIEEVGVWMSGLWPASVRHDPTSEARHVA
jgi:simple sugar transport system ATP-binding protein